MKNSMLTLGLAALMCAACSNDLTEDENNATKGGERYMAISLVTGTGNNTRGDADESEYEDGTEDEYAAIADNTYFFFFDENGQPITVTTTGENYVTGSNFKGWKTDAETKDHVTTLSDVITVINTPTNVIPKQVVAVINATFTPNQTTTLDDLRTKEIKSAADGYITKDDGKKYYMMSNSAYYDGTSEVYATQVSVNNFATNADDAASNPVRIYVERVVAKVAMETEMNTTKELTDADKYLDDTKLSVKVIGWKLFNTAKTTTLEKSIAGYASTDAAKSFTGWNDKDACRSFWSVVDKGLELDDVTLTWKNVSESNETVYPFENTKSTVAGEDNHTSVAIACRLVDGEGETVELGYWLSKYRTKEDTQKAIANYLANDVFSYADGKWTPITYDNIIFVKDGSYQVQPNIKTTDGTNTISWYEKNSSTAYTDKEIEAIVNKIPKASIWEDGMCYYFSEITHTNNVPAVVRNHVYKVNVNSISGVGTPVIDPTDPFDPVRPDDTQEWYLDAQMYVQAWKIVTNNIDFKTTTNN
jgi:hypothetical protein